MTTTEEAILSQAARIRAGRRKRLLKHCEVCGQPFEGIAQRRYCSDRCRMRAARGQGAAQADEFERIVLPGPREGESFREFFLRARSEEIERGEIEGDPSVLTPEQEEQIAALERIWQRAEKVRREHGLLDDSTEILRQQREARVRHLTER